MNATILTFLFAGVLLLANAAMLILIVAVALILAGVVIWYARKRRTESLRERFGPEYERTVSETGTARKAEKVLAKREKRVAAYHIRPLAAADRERLSQAWREVQARFVDDPNRAVARADQLIGEVLEARGYPLSDFWQRAEDLSVDHPVVVENPDSSSSGAGAIECLRKISVLLCAATGHFSAGCLRSEGQATSPGDYCCGSLHVKAVGEGSRE